MENNEKNIDDLFREELGGYTETPPRAVWNALEKKLAKVPKRGSFPNRKIWYFGMLCLLLLLSIPAIRQIAGIANSRSKAIAANETAKTKVTSTPAGTNTNPREAAGNVSNATRANKDNTLANQSPALNATIDKEEHNTETNKISDRNAKNKDVQSKTLTDNKIAQNQHKTSTKEKAATNNKTKQAGNKQVTTNNVHKYSNERTVAEKRAQQPLNNVYNSSSNISKPASAEETEDETTTGEKQGKVNEAKPAPQKTAAPAPNKKPLQKTEITKQPKPKFNRFEAGVKVGYERGFDNDAAKKGVISPYIQYNVSPRFSLMTQPAVKIAFMETRRIGNPTSYYKQNNDSTVAAKTDYDTVHMIDGSKYFLWHYKYSQTYDSIVKSNTIGGTYLEFEIPLLLKYKLSKALSVYGGINIIYSKLVSVNENTYTNKGLVKTDSSNIELGPVGGPAPAPQYTFSSLFKYNGTDYANYTGPQYPTPQKDLWRVGYMLGFSCELNKRWLFDGLVQQGSVKSNVQAGYNINNTLSAPYFRFTLGYKLLK